MKANHSSHESATEPPPFAVLSLCPVCNGPLALRRNRQDGEAFVGCRNFPRCKFTQEFEAREQALAARVVELEERVDDLEAELDVERATRAALPAGIVSKELRDLIFRWHPDRRRDPIPPHEVVAELTRLRAQVAA